MSGSATRIRRATDPHHFGIGGLMAGRSLPLKDRLLMNAHTEPNSGCWLWSGVIQSQGYGRLRINGDKNRTILAHRASWEVFFGPVPDGMMVAHRCDYRLCINPDHLFLADAQVNLTDMAIKGRGRKSLIGLPFGVALGWPSAKKPFIASVGCRGRHHFLGYFDTAEEAGAAALEFKRRCHGGEV